MAGAYWAPPTPPSFQYIVYKSNITGIYIIDCNNLANIRMSEEECPYETDL